MGRVVGVAFVALAALVLAACGGSGDDAPPTSAEQRYFAELQSIQQQGNQLAERIPSLEDVNVADGVDDAELAKLAEFVGVTRRLHEAIGDALRQLVPPPSLRDAHFAYADAMAQVATVAASAEDSLEDRDAVAASFSGIVRTTTASTEACQALQREASERGIAVDLLCG